MNNIQKLFQVAVNGESKAERRNAYRQLREISIRGAEDEAREARFALAHSAEYLKQLPANP